ncbi:MAG: S1C family serine protease [Candidatus Omnitrophica bacterium]|nr:S1C family serine protease [Candidatus Omnitrophota bacterium]
MKQIWQNPFRSDIIILKKVTMKKIIVLLLVLLVLDPPISLAETIKLKDGRIIEALIVERLEGSVKINFMGAVLTYYYDDIESIDGQDIDISKNQLTSSSLRGEPKTPQDIFSLVSPAVVHIFQRSSLGGEKPLGSGFIIDSQGVVVTNQHVIKNAPITSVKLKDGRNYPVEGFIYQDVERDICILKIKAKDLPTVSLVDLDSTEKGEKIYCIADPSGLGYSFSEGVVSGWRKEINRNWLQFTAPISPGYSGSPLINSKGEIVGIVTAGMIYARNINFALDINEIKPFISKTIKLSFVSYLEDVNRAEPYRKEVLQYNETVLAPMVERLARAGGDFSKFTETEAELEATRKAAEAMSKYLEIIPNDQDMLSQALKAWGILNDYEKVLFYAKKLSGIIPFNCTNYISIGDALAMHVGDLPAAAKAYQKAIELLEAGIVPQAVVDAGIGLEDVMLLRTKEKLQEIKKLMK